MNPVVHVGPTWTKVTFAEPVWLNDLIRNAPEPPFALTELHQQVDYFRSCSANLLYLDGLLPADQVQWMDPHNRLFEAKAYRFLAALRDRPPSAYELNWPFRLPPDPWQGPIFTYGRSQREIALAPTAIGSGKSKMTLDIAADKFMREEIDGLIIVPPNGVHRQWIVEAVPTHLTTEVLIRTMI